MKATRDFYLDGLRRMDWDTFQFGSYRMKEWHYDEVLDFLDCLEHDVFPWKDYKVVKTDKGIDYDGKQQFDLYNVEDYIKDCHAMYETPTLEMLFDFECRELFRNGKVVINGRILTFTEARAYAESKIDKKLLEIYNFKEC